MSIPKVLLLLTVGAVLGIQAAALLTPTTTAVLALTAVAAFVTITTVRHRRTGTRRPEGATPKLEGAPS